MKNIKPYNDRAPRNGSKGLDTLSKLAIVAGLVGLLTIMWYGGKVADALIGLIKMVWKWTFKLKTDGRAVLFLS